jgi:hypothetical protein
VSPESGDLPVRDDHDVAAVVGVVVEERVTAPGPDHDEVCLVIVPVGDPLEDRLLARGRFRREDVLDPPRGVELFHRSERRGTAGPSQNAGRDAILF